MWETAHYTIKLQILAGESSVMIELLLEHATLVAMIKRGESQATCLNYINENF